MSGGLSGAASDESANEVMPLVSLPVGVPARIAAPPPGRTISRRLGDLGFVPGTELLIVRRAPFGDPVELEIRGYRLCLRAEQMEEIRVTPLGLEP
jgi:Fe2+ transport system protein FeoA